MSLAMFNLFKEISATPPQRLVGYMLAESYDDETGNCSPSIRDLIEVTSLSKRAIQNALKSLEKNRHLTRIPQAGAVTRYALHPNLLFNSAG